MMRRFAIAAVATLLTLGATACGDEDGQPTATATKTVTASPGSSASESPTPTESDDPFAPNVGDRALKVGQARVGQSFATTLRQVKVLPSDPMRVPGDGNVFLGLNIQECLTADPGSEVLTTDNSEFAAVTPSGNEYAGDGSYWNDWPAPKFPETKSMIQGRCNQGWLAIEIPKGTKVSSILWRPGGTATAEWLMA